MKDLKDSSRALLDAYKASVGPSQPDGHHNWEEIQRRLEEDDIPELSDDVAQERPRRRKLWWMTSGAAAVALTWGVSLLLPQLGNRQAESDRFASSLEQRDEATQTARALRPRPSSSTAATQGGSLTTPPAPAEPLVATPKASAPKAPTSRPKLRHESPKAPAPSTDTITRESAALWHARVALRDGSPDKALRLLSNYEREFPHGELRDTASLLRVRCLCSAGRERRARQAAKQIMKQQPGSTVARRAAKICAE